MDSRATLSQDFVLVIGRKGPPSRNQTKKTTSEKQASNRVTSHAEQDEQTSENIEGNAEEVAENIKYQSLPLKSKQNQIT